MAVTLGFHLTSINQYRCHRGLAMNDSYSPSGFALPPRHPVDGRNSAPGLPADLDAWISVQQSTDPLAAATQLLEAVRSINRTSIEFTALAGLTAVLLARIPPILDEFDARLRQLPLPLGPKSQSLAVAHASLLQELAMACLRLVEDGLQERRMRSSEAGGHLRFALLLSGCRCLHFWRFYHPVPEGSWLQIHRILALGERLGVADDAATEASGSRAIAPDSIAALAARIAVLGSTDVHTLRHGEAECLARWLQSVPLRCSEGIPRDAAESTRLLQLRLDEDRAPSVLTGPPEPGGNVRYVDLAPVLSAIGAGSMTYCHPGVWDPVSSGAAQRLRSFWSDPPRRRQPRQPAEPSPVIAATGLLDIHALIRADYRHQRKAANSGLAVLAGTSGTDLTRMSARFLAAIGYPEDGQPFALAIEPGNPPLRDPRASGPDRTVEWLQAAWDRMLHDVGTGTARAGVSASGRAPRPTAGRLRDLGAGGLSLSLQSPAQKLFTGDLIALRALRDRHIVWQLGMIQWLRDDGPGGINVGIRHLAPVCVPTDIQLFRGNRPCDPTQHGLFLPHGERPDAGSLLFIPGAFAAGVQVFFHVAGGDHVVELESVDAGGPGFARADFTLPASLTA
jgi:cyclic-di-GMP-binding protein